MNGDDQLNSLHFTVLTALKADRLREILAHDERHLAILGKSIENQERFIEGLDNSGPSDSTIINTARELLGFMKSARVGYIADCDRIRRLLEKFPSAVRQKRRPAPRPTAESGHDPQSQTSRDTWRPVRRAARSVTESLRAPYAATSARARRCNTRVESIASSAFSHFPSTERNGRTTACDAPAAVAWRPGFLGFHVTNAPATRTLLSFYPAEIREWIARNGGLTDQMLYLSGRDLLGLYRECR